MTMTLTGAQIERVLEQQFAGCTLATARILQVSTGFTYTWTASGPVGEKVDRPRSDQRRDRGPGRVLPRDGQQLPRRRRRQLPALKLGTDRLGGAVDTDALEAYFVANSPVAPGPQNRITLVP